MVKVDLITGFLGSGKTTFLKKYAKYFLNQGKRIAIIENDFGAVNVDMMLLQELMCDNLELEMIAGGCDADCHKRRFKTKLIAMGMLGFDRVIIEPSGIFDVDEFFDVLREEPLDRWYEIGNVFAIVDAKLQKDLSKESRYLLATQLSCAGKVILSKSQFASRQDIDTTIDSLADICKEFQCKTDIRNICFDKSFEKLENEDFENLMKSGYSSNGTAKLWFEHGKTFNSKYYMNLKLTKDEIIQKVKELFEDSNYGNIFRIKGFLKDENEAWYQLNATKDELSLSPIDVGQEVIIIIGEDLAQEKIDSLMNDNICFRNGE